MIPCKLSDFSIDKQERRVYGSGTGRQTLLLVNIKNKVTGVTLNDWVRPDQIKTRDAICSLIDWGYYKRPAGEIAGDLKCDKAFITVSRNNDETLNVDGVTYEDGREIEFNKVPVDFVKDLMKRYGC